MLRFGFIAGERRESIWPHDEAVGEIPAAAQLAFSADGEAEHLRPYVKPGQTPARIVFRTLTQDEASTVEVLSLQVAKLRAWEMAFRMGVDFPDAPETIGLATGGTGSKTERWRGFVVLSDGFVRALKAQYPGIVMFYGKLVFDSSFPSEPEKKASSPPPMPTLSVGSTEPAASSPAPGAA